jgi:tRNA dimethylallyltransferase
MSGPRVACLVGPTASGKTALALELAEALDAEIVSADSRQVYRGMDVGTAKPSGAERARVPHHCLDLVDPHEVFDAARYRTAAAAAIADINRRGRRALVVGGTGLYVRVLLRGLCPAPPRVPAIRRALGRLAVAEGVAALHRHLVVIDPTAAARIHPRDTVRTQRALEVAFATGRRLSDWQAVHAFGVASYEALVIGLALPTAVLDARITTRTQAMVAAGFADEVRALRARVGGEAPVWRTVGYREMRAYVEGRASREQALAATVLATRRFAKRQRTWFRGEPSVVWRHPEHDRDRIRAEMSAFLAGTAGLAARA